MTYLIENKRVCLQKTGSWVAKATTRRRRPATRSRVGVCRIRRRPAPRAARPRRQPAARSRCQSRAVSRYDNTSAATTAHCLRAREAVTVDQVQSSLPSRKTAGVWPCLPAGGWSQERRPAGRHARRSAPCWRRWLPAVVPEPCANRAGRGELGSRSVSTTPRLCAFFRNL
jgi:hypothetical protein